MVDRNLWLFNSTVNQDSFKKLSASENINTAFEYMYRNASNYKCYKTVVFEGKITEREILGILYHLNGGECFIPGQVGLPDLQSELNKECGISTIWDDDEDHCWHEPVLFALTVQEPTENCTISDFASTFMKTEWNEDYLPEDDWNLLP